MRYLPWWLALTACGPQVAVTEWEPLDHAALLSLLDNPTATLADLEAVGEAVERAVGAGDVVELVQAVTADEPPEEPEPEPSTTATATTVWVRVACPGPDVVPDPEFAYGWIQVESPLLRDESDALVLSGDLYVTVDACEVTDTVWDGTAIAYWDPATETLLAQSQLGVHLVDDPERAVIVTGVETSPSRKRRSITVGDKTATLEERSEDGLTWALILADAEILCTVESGSATCSTRAHTD